MQAATIEKTQPRALPPVPARIHFVGIGGIGMSGLARILRAWGYQVSGSDAAPGDQAAALAAEGIPITIGHTDTARAGAAELVVMTAAVRGANPEIDAARIAGVPIVKRAELLGLLSNARRGVAVAGSAGKSTTSGMLAAALRTLGADPSYAIGAVLDATGTNAAPGTGAEMVVEADEYDYSFLWLRPEVAIVTNIDYDHPDLFPDQDTYDAAFARFVANIRPGGTLVLAADDPGCVRLRARPDFAAPANLVTFGQSAAADWRLDRVGDRWRVTAPNGEDLPLRLLVPGAHNARNAVAALAALAALGQEPVAAAAALETFAGVGRRFEIKGNVGGVLVVDDYAHHPSKIRAALQATRERFPDRRLWAVFQPHTYSRTQALLPDFVDALTEADRVMVLDIYAARETDTLGIAAQDLVARLPEGTLLAGQPPDAARTLAGQVEPGDVVLTLGAGDVTETGPRLLDLLAHRPTPASVSRRRERPAAPATIAIPDRPGLKVLRDSPMSLHTTWRIGGPADFLVRVPTPDDLVAAVTWGRTEGLPVTVIGGGSNLLVGDGGIRGLVLLARTPGERAEGLVRVEDLGDAVRLRVAAQAPLSWSGRYAAERGWSGLDWGVGLPGTIGGATVNNAGAHGTEQKDHLERVVVLDNEGRVRELPGSWLEPSYRHTRIKHGPRPRSHHVLEAVFVLPKGEPAALVRLADEHAAFRKQTQPTGACAGSTFANPPDDFAGRLLEETCMKGYRVGAAGFSPKHANWIVNAGGSTAAEVRALIATARERVRERFGVELVTEIEEVGEP